MQLGEMVVKFAADVQNFTRGAQQVTESVTKIHQTAQVHMRGFTDSVKGGLSSLLEFGAHAYQTFLGVSSVIQQVTGVVGGWIQGAIQAQQNQAALNAVLASTHDAVGMTAAQINAMVQNLKNLDGIDDDVIQSGTNMLLTFTNIGSSVFPQANQAMLDMAVAMNHGSTQGLDLKDTAIQLGKALNDPIAGISALSRVGVTFTQQQQDQIKAMVDAGNVAGAQTLIINELEREFGGAAKAAGNTDPFSRFQLAMGDIGKALGGLLLPPLTALANLVTPVANDFLTWLGTLNQTGGAFSQLGSLWNNIILPPLQEIGRIIKVDTKPGMDALGDAVGKLLAPFQHLSDIHVNWRPVLNQINNLVWEGTQAFDSLATGVDAVVTGVSNGKGPFGFLQGVMQTVAGDLSQVGQALSPLGGLLADLGNQLASGSFTSFQQTLSDWGPIVQQVAGWFQSQMLPALLQLVPPAERLINVLATKGLPAFFAVRDAVSHVASVVASTLLPIWEKLEPIVVRLAGYLLDLGQKALAFLLPKVEDAAKAVSKFATEMGTRLQPFIDRVSQGIQVAADIISKVWGYLWPWMSGILKLAWDDITGVINIAWQFISGLFKIFADILSGNWGQMWADIKQTALNIWDAIKSLVGNLWGDLKHLWDVGTGYISGVWNTVWNGLVGIVSSVWNGVLGVIQGGVNGAIDIINKLIDVANHVPGVHISHIPHVSFTGNPTGSGSGSGQGAGHYAAGGLVPQTGLAMVGERGPEMMLLPGGTRIFTNEFVQQLALLASSLGGGSLPSSPQVQQGGSQVQQGGGITVYPSSSATSTQPASAGGQTLHLTLEMGGRAFANLLMPFVIGELRANGVRI